MQSTATATVPAAVAAHELPAQYRIAIDRELPNRRVRGRRRRTAGADHEHRSDIGTEFGTESGRQQATQVKFVRLSVVMLLQLVLLRREELIEVPRGKRELLAGFGGARKVRRERETRLGRYGAPHGGRVREGADPTIEGADRRKYENRRE